MRLFSERKGLTKRKNIIQINDMDIELRTRLWNTLTICLWKRIPTTISISAHFSTFFQSLWIDYFKKPLDTLDDYTETTYKELRSYFFECKWYEVYDFIEFIANYFPEYQPVTKEDFIKFCNDALEKELSAYRFVGNKIIQITSKEEIVEIEEALKSPFEAVNRHLSFSLKHWSDRKNPDYRNSIKESISAVEALCKIITKNKKATLGDALKEIEKSKVIELHGALKSAFDKLYGYTNDEKGIRHALLDKDKIETEDAKFMLVSCSAFINYLITKSQKAKIKV